MGNNQHTNRMEHKQHESSRNIIYHTDSSYLGAFIQRSYKMAETKLAAILLNLLGIPLCFISFMQNIDNVKSAVLFILAVCFLMFRIYFFVIWAKQKTRRNELELQKMEQDLAREK